jgi:hypothetical protein
LRTARLLNTWPLHMTVVDSTFIDNFGMVGHLMNLAPYSGTQQADSASWTGEGETLPLPCVFSLLW